LPQVCNQPLNGIAAYQNAKRATRINSYQRFVEFSKAKQRDINPLFYERLGFSVVADGRAKSMLLRFSDSEELPAEIPTYF
jgi:hypothetical protein